LAQSASYWPSVADMMNQWRSFATARLPLSGCRNVCAFAVIQKVPRILIASSDGYLYIYDLNMNEGGDCNLVKQHRLDANSEEVLSAVNVQGNVSYAAVVRGFDPNCISSTTASSALSPISSSPSAAEQSPRAPPRSDSPPDYDGDFPPMTYTAGF